MINVSHFKQVIQDVEHYRYFHLAPFDDITIHSYLSNGTGKMHRFYGIALIYLDNYSEEQEDGTTYDWGAGYYLGAVDVWKRIKIDGSLWEKKAKCDFYSSFYAMPISVGDFNIEEEAEDKNPLKLRKDNNVVVPYHSGSPLLPEFYYKAYKKEIHDSIMSQDHVFLTALIFPRREILIKNNQVWQIVIGTPLSSQMFGGGRILPLFLDFPGPIFYEQLFKLRIFDESAWPYFISLEKSLKPSVVIQKKDGIQFDGVVIKGQPEDDWRIEDISAEQEVESLYISDSHGGFVLTKDDYATKNSYLDFEIKYRVSTYVHESYYGGQPLMWQGDMINYYGFESNSCVYRKEDYPDEWQVNCGDYCSNHPTGECLTKISEQGGCYKYKVCDCISENFGFTKRCREEKCTGWERIVSIHVYVWPDPVHIPYVRRAFFKEPKLDGIALKYTYPERVFLSRMLTGYVPWDISSLDNNFARFISTFEEADVEGGLKIKEAVIGENKTVDIKGMILKPAEYEMNYVIHYRVDGEDKYTQSGGMIECRESLVSTGDPDDYDCTCSWTPLDLNLGLCPDGEPQHVYCKLDKIHTIEIVDISVSMKITDPSWKGDPIVRNITIPINQSYSTDMRCTLLSVWVYVKIPCGSPQDLPDEDCPAWG